MITRMEYIAGITLPFSALWVGLSLVTTVGLSLIVSVVPAWWATRISPAVALRYE
jgi:ABC-type lipoprotein release transport system permease subunit